MKKFAIYYPVIFCLILLMLVSGCREEKVSGPGKETVGVDFSGRMVVPVNQVIQPYGLQVQLPGLRPQGLALSPDGKLVAVSGKSNELVIIDPVDLRIKQKVPLPPESQNEPLPETVSENILEPDTKGQLSYNGLVFSPDGSRIYLSNVNGSLKVFTVHSDGQVRPSHTILLPPAKAPRREEEIPSGLAFSQDGKRLYVCGNLSNQLLEIEAATGQVLRAFPVGVAPFEVVVKGNKAYVSNWGGRRPGPDDLVGPAGRGTVVRVDPEKFIASEGSVTVIDLASGQVIKDIMVHLHSSALALSPSGRYLVCANAASDNLSVIDTEKDEVVETIWVKRSPADLFGASPNALCFLPDGNTLLVANGTQNAVAVVDFRPKKKKSQLKGLIPAGWFPGVLAWDKNLNRLWVANIKGLPDRPRTEDSTGRTGFNTHQYYGSLSVFNLPAKKSWPG